MLPRPLSLVALLLATGHAAAADTPTDRGPRAATPVRLPSSTGQKLDQPGLRGITHSVARRWNDELLQAIIRDRPRPTVNARNLYHVSAAMYDAWAAYDTTATPVFRREFGKALDTEAARNEAVSHAAYRVCSHRFLTSPGHIASQAAFDALMANLGYDINNTSTTGDSPPPSATASPPPSSPRASSIPPTSRPTSPTTPATHPSTAPSSSATPAPAA